MKHISTFGIFESKIESPVLYHGTNKNFDDFEMKGTISNPTYGDVADQGLGFFFTDNLTMARWFAGMIEFNGDMYVPTKKKGRIIEAKLNLKNPYVITGKDPKNEEDGAQEYFKQIKDAGGVDKFKSKLQKAKYDGVIVKECTTNYYNEDSYEVWVAFDKKQIEISNE